MRGRIWGYRDMGRMEAAYLFYLSGRTTKDAKPASDHPRTTSWCLQHHIVPVGGGCEGVGDKGMRHGTS